MTAKTETDRGLFEGGPPIGLQRRLGLVPPGPLRAGRRLVLAMLIAWLPLAILAAAQSALGNEDVFFSFLSDLAVHGRLLVCLPMLILAETVCTPRLGHIANHFRDSGLIRDSDLPRFEAAVASTIRLRDSTAAEFLVILAACTLVATLLLTVPHDQLPSWHSPTRSGYSWAGWWHGLVSMPLMNVLLLGWLWRLFLWTRLLARIANMDLLLIPAHPDQAAGLRFVGHSLRAFGILGFALGALVAGTVANGVIHEGLSFAHYGYAIAGVVICSIVLFCGPLLLFLPKLLQEWRRGIFQYGALADSFGREFESKWFDGRKIDREALQTQDFSAATDLYQVVGNVYAMRTLPMDLKSVLLLAIATLLPFLPVVLLAIPMDTILATLAGFML